MTSLLQSFSKLLEPIGNGRANREEDVSQIRSDLARLNYRTDDDKASGIFTSSLDRAIRTFQGDENLKTDGWLRPGGPTEERLTRRLKQSFPSEGRPLASTILEDQYDEDVQKLIRRGEGYSNKIYLDSKGNPTIGVGFMIPSLDVAKTYPFYKMSGENFTSDRADIKDIEKAFSSIKKQEPDLLVSDYLSKTDIGLRDEDILSRLNQKLRSSVDELETKFSDFRKIPKKAQLGLLDMQFNLGNPKFQRSYIDPKTKEKKGWPNFFDAYERKDWQQMAIDSHRKDVQKSRNDEIFGLFNEAQ